MRMHIILRATLCPQKAMRFRRALLVLSDFSWEYAAIHHGRREGSCEKRVSFCEKWLFPDWRNALPMRFALAF
jgi:hypothetical protein